MKRGTNFFKVWGGIPGVQHTLPLLITAWRERCSESSQGSALQAIARLTSFNVAERFKLPPTKGRIALGAEADLVLVDLKSQCTVRREELRDRHQQSPYVGRALTGCVVRTILRGRTLCQDGRLVAPSGGWLVKPVGV
jgi:allantoinase